MILVLPLLFRWHWITRDSRGLLLESLASLRITGIPGIALTLPDKVSPRLSRNYIELSCPRGPAPALSSTPRL